MSDYTKKYSWSMEGDEFFGEHATREEALAECMNCISAEIETSMEVWTAEVVTPSEMIDKHLYGLVDNLLTTLDEEMDFYTGSDGSVVAFTDGTVDAVAEAVKSIILERGAFRRFAIKDEQKHVVPAKRRA